jgi:hypothetical protein
VAGDSRELIDLLLDLHLDGRDEQFFDTVSPRETAEAWCRVTARSTRAGADDEDAWALLALHTITSEERRRELLGLLVECASDYRTLELVGARPLEDFLRDRDESRIRWAVGEADRSARFRYALAHASVSDLGTENFLRLEHRPAT